MDKENKTLDCVEPTCAIPKSPNKPSTATPNTPDGISAPGKKRNRKKKTSESEKTGANANELLHNNQQSDEADGSAQGQGGTQGQGSIVVVIAAAAIVIGLLGIGYFTEFLD